MDNFTIPTALLQQSRGDLPDGNEDCIYELIAYAENALGKAPSRTAVQRNMGAELYVQNATQAFRACIG